MKIQTLFLLLLVIFLTSCQRSLTYSTSLNLPVEPMKKGGFEVQGSVEWFPETVPEERNGELMSAGLSGQVAFGLSDNVSLTLRGWMERDLSSQGLLVGVRLHKNLNQNYTIYGISRFGLLANEFFFFGNSAYGSGNSIVITRKIGKHSNIYVGTGLYSLYDFLLEWHPDKSYLGMMIISNIGFAINVNDDTRFNIECNPIFNMPNQYRGRQFLLAPSIGMAINLQDYKKKNEVDL